MLIPALSNNLEMKLLKFLYGLKLVFMKKNIFWEIVLFDDVILYPVLHRSSPVGPVLFCIVP